MKNNVLICAIVLLVVSIATVILVFCFVPAIPQELSYHHFANDIPVVSIPNFYNVVSNVGFITSGIWGFVVLKNSSAQKRPSGWLLFAGMILTGFGSAYYHYSPANETLVWDRLPMVLVFSSFFAEVCACYFGHKPAQGIWIFTLCAGISSIVYWYYTEEIGKGDLRPYAIVQFLPMLLMFIMFAVLYDRNKFIHTPLLATVLFYAGAKLFEHYDHYFFEHTHFCGGHPIKHLLASFATACIVWFIKVTMKKQVLNLQK